MLDVMSSSCFFLNLLFERCVGFPKGRTALRICKLPHGGGAAKEPLQSIDNPLTVAPEAHRATGPLCKTNGFTDSSEFGPVGSLGKAQHDPQLSHGTSVAQGATHWRLPGQLPKRQGCIHVLAKGMTHL